MNSSSIVFSFMLAGFIFLLGHNLIAGPVGFSDAKVTTAEQKVSSVKALKQPSEHHEIIRTSLETIEAQL